jgi:hypothetical protein
MMATLNISTPIRAAMSDADEPAQPDSTALPAYHKHILKAFERMRCSMLDSLLRSLPERSALD